MKVYYWHNPTNHRFYLVTRESDLFDDFVITHIAGGAKCKKGKKILTMPMASRKDAADHIKTLKRIRKKHGYKRLKIINNLMI